MKSSASEPGLSKFIYIFEHSDSDYTFLVMFPAGVTSHGYALKALWPMPLTGLL